MPLIGNTRLKHFPLSSKAKGSESPLSFTFNKIGMLSRIFLGIKGTITGTLTSPNPLGKASIIRSVEVAVNTGYRLMLFSGAGYHYLIRDMLEHYVDAVPQSDARAAVATGAFDLSMIIPIALNTRDDVGLFPLQNEETQVTLTVDFEADANVAAGATVAATVEPVMEILSFPPRREDWPQFALLHTLIEEKRAIAAAGDNAYMFPRGNAYLQLLMAYGIGVTGADNFTQVIVQAGTDVTDKWTPDRLSAEFASHHGRARLAGAIPLDWIGSSGLGAFGSVRDAIFSQSLSDLQAVITASAAGNLYAIRRELVQVVGR